MARTGYAQLAGAPKDNHFVSSFSPYPEGRHESSIKRRGSEQK